MNDVQVLVDALAAELHRPIGVDDRHFRVLAFSPHFEGDRVRLVSILRREAPEEVRSWLESVGVHEAKSVLRVPANPELEMAARVCVPLEFDGVPLGYLWMLDDPEPLSDAQLESIAPYAEELGTALYRARLLERDDRQHERELVGQLIGRRNGDSEAAAAELLAGNYLVKAPAYAVMSLRVVCGDREDTSDPVQLRAVDAAEQVRRAVAPRQLLVLVEANEVVAVLACAAAGDLARRAEALAEAAARNLEEAPEVRALIGVSEECSDLAALPEAHLQAATAARVATAAGISGPVVTWSSLGAYRTLAGLIGDADPRALLPESFQRLLAAGDDPTLIETLERYLDLGGDARAAAEAMFLHRSSLYGRLHRIEEIAGVDLRSGEDRLELHLALRLWHLGDAQRH